MSFPSPSHFTWPRPCGRRKTLAHRNSTSSNVVYIPVNMTAVDIVPFYLKASDIRQHERAEQLTLKFPRTVAGGQRGCGAAAAAVRVQAGSAQYVWRGQHTEPPSIALPRSCARTKDWRSASSSGVGIRPTQCSNTPAPTSCKHAQWQTVSYSTFTMTHQSARAWRPPPRSEERRLPG